MSRNYTQEELDSGLNTEVDAKILADRKNGTIVMGTKATDQLINSYKRKILGARGWVRRQGHGYPAELQGRPARGRQRRRRPRRRRRGRLVSERNP